MLPPSPFDRLVEPSDHQDVSPVPQARDYLIGQGFTRVVASAVADFALMEGVLPLGPDDGGTILAADDLTPLMHPNLVDSPEEDSLEPGQRVRQFAANLLRQRGCERWRKAFRCMRFSCIEDFYSGQQVAFSLLSEREDLVWALQNVMDLREQPDMPNRLTIPSGFTLQIDNVRGVQEALFWALLFDQKFPSVAFEQFTALPDERVYETVRTMYAAFTYRTTLAELRILNPLSMPAFSAKDRAAYNEAVDRTASERSLMMTAATYAFEPYLNHVTARFDATSNNDMALGLAWVMLFRIVNRRELPSALDESDHRRMLAGSRAHMAKLRSIIRRTAEEDADAVYDVVEDAFDTERGTFLAPVTLLFESGDLWEATKALLQLIRVSPKPVVGDDLRFTDGRFLSTRDPWHLIGLELFRGLQNSFRREQEGDPDLSKFREALCRYCLDRLRSKDRSLRSKSASSKGLVEPNPLWRYGYLRASQELHINPENRGHHVLHWLMQNDPEQRIRESAEIAYKRLSNHAKLPSGMSPRRAVFAALWWIRQVHRLSLGLEIDARAAQQTRDTEVRMTQSPTG
ncbi:MAG: hypothetical protein WD294_02425 [Phycisphaeraceae bacterium]